MKNYKQQIKEYKEEIEEKYVRAEAENKTVKACQNILSELVLSKQSHRTSYFEFLYEQTKFIKKRWWILQGCVLMCLWIWLSNYTSDPPWRRPRRRAGRIRSPAAAPTAITGTFCHNIEQLSVRLRMKFIKHTPVNVETVLEVGFCRKHLIEAVGRDVHDTLL